jgi:hypothetical protein
MEMRQVVVVTVLVTLATLLVAVPRAAGATVPERAGEAARIDFNGDGFDDLAVGAPGEAVGGLFGAGAVNVLYGLAVGSHGEADSGASAGGAVNILYGSAGGLTGGPQFFQPTPETNDRFGASLAAGDFNGDEFFDLAVGAPLEDVRDGGRRRGGHGVQRLRRRRAHPGPALHPGERWARRHRRVVRSVRARAGVAHGGRGPAGRG